MKEKTNEIMQSVWAPSQMANELANVPSGTEEEED